MGIGIEIAAKILCPINESISNPSIDDVVTSSLLTDLESFWKLEESSGNAIDELGNANLSETGSIGTATGKIGNARNLSGSGQYFSTSKANVSALYGGADFTIGGWMASDANATNSLCSVYGASGNRCWLLQHGSNWRLLASSDGSATVNTGFVGSSTTAGTFYHWLLEWDESAEQFEFYVNNSSIATLSVSGGLFDSTHDFNLGSRENGTDLWDGKLDAVGIWSRILTSDEKSELYNSGDGVEHPF